MPRLQQGITQYSSKITDDDRIRLQIPVHDIMRSTIPRPTISPLFTLRFTKTPRQIAILIFDPDTNEPHIPYGMNGAVIYFKAVGPGEPVPLTEEDLPYKVRDKR